MMVEAAATVFTLSERGGQMTLVLEDLGGETLDGFLSASMEITEFLGLATGLATALGGLHERKLIHKDVKSWSQGSYIRSRAKYHMQLLVPSLNGQSSMWTHPYSISRVGGGTTPIPSAQRNVIGTEGVACLCPQLLS